MNILIVSTTDIGGGAEKTGWYLHNAYQARGHHSSMAVAWKLSDDPYIFQIPNERYPNHLQSAWRRLGDLVIPLAGRIKGAGRITNMCYDFAMPQRQGRDFFPFPASKRVLEFTSRKPDIIHCLNLHCKGGYFDLRALQALSRKVPIVLTLNDAWLLTGHCAHPFGCERWKSGCGQCPDLSAYFPISRDATKSNWRRKQRIYRHSKLYAGVTSRWLMGLVEQSMLAPELVEKQLINYAIDTSIFHPGDKPAARDELNLPQDAKILLFTAVDIRKNPFKDYQMLREAVTRVAEQLKHEHILFIALGDDGPVEQVGSAEIHFIPFQKNPRNVARYCQAADVYLHAAKAEVWGIVITEAMACGTPVVATEIGGIPEQVQHGYSGFLVPPGDAKEMAYFIRKLLEEPQLYQKMGHRAADSAKQYSVERMVKSYLEWYNEILEASH